MAIDFNIQQYNYHLPEERIAKFPLKERDKSKLLVWKNKKISHHIFKDVATLLPEGSLLVFNDTKVIAARLLFQKSTGARIEIFLLHPELPTRDISESMTVKNNLVWSCMIGNKKKWKAGELACYIDGNILKASFHDRDRNLVRFEWSGEETFADLINKVGETPLPPYLKRKPVKEDSRRYQTVYSMNNGAVAAPTAGLHFTESILDEIKAKNIGLEYLTLHVSAGTFKPVEVKDYRTHEMHKEQIIISKKSIYNLMENSNHLIPVGTTSLRMLESLYWYGNLLMEDENASFFIPKNLPYKTRSSNGHSFKASLIQIANYLEKNQLNELRGETEIFIHPGYQIKTALGLFTNFHLPKSTLLLLISVFVDEDWKSIYNEALEKNYRFLSYGDSSLLLR